MADIIFPTVKNQKLTTLAASITSSATSLDVVSATALGIPSISGSNFHLITLIAIGNWHKNPITSPETFEIVKVTAVSIGGGAGGSDRLTITRAQDNTTGTAFAVGDVAEARLTAGHLDRIQNALTDGSTGNLNVAAVDVNGDLTVSGVGVNTLWARWLSAIDGILGTTPAGGPTAREIGTSANATGFHCKTLDFDQTTDEYAHFHVKLPNDYDGRVIRIRFIWVAVAGTAGAVNWRIYAKCYGDNTAPGANVLITAQADTFLATNTLHIIEKTFTPNSSTAGDYLHLTIRRFASDAGDTFDADACLLGIELSY